MNKSHSAYSQHAPLTTLFIEGHFVNLLINWKMTFKNILNHTGRTCNQTEVCHRSKSHDKMLPDGERWFCRYRRRLGHRHGRRLVSITCACTLRLMTMTSGDCFCWDLRTHRTCDIYNKTSHQLHSCTNSDAVCLLFKWHHRSYDQFCLFPYNTFHRSVVCLSICPSHSCPLVKLFDDFTCYLIGTLATTQQQK